MRATLGLLILVAPVLAGCVSSDRVPSPPVVEGSLTGVVVDLEGNPIADAIVWVEDRDLTRPVNNVAAYEAFRTATLTRTDQAGEFMIPVDPGQAAWVTARHPGHRPARGAPDVDSTWSHVVIRMAPTRDVLVISHRGGPDYAPENTLAAHRKSVLLGSQLIELDVQLTADNQLVVMHDLRVDRTTDGAGAVRSMQLADIQALDAGSWYFMGDFAGERPPSLRQVYDAVKDEDVRLIVDVKAPPGLFVRTTQAVADLTRSYGYEDRVLVASLNNEAVAECREQADFYCVLMSGTSRSEDDVAALASQSRPDAVRIVATRFNEAFASRLEAAGHEIWLGEANTPTAWALGLHSTVYALGTDQPAELIQFLADRQAQNVLLDAVDQD